MACKKCGLCCHFWDGIDVASWLDTGVPEWMMNEAMDTMKMVGPPGCKRCVALKKGLCSIYEDRPGTCRHFLCRAAGGEHVLPIIMKRDQVRKIAPRYLKESDDSQAATVGKEAAA